MGFNLRGAILQNIANNSPEEVEETITDAIQSGEEKMLPGLGVMFEVYWKHASEQEKQECINQISKGLQR